MPVERGGVEGCEGDAEAEEVSVTSILLTIIINFFINVLLTIFISFFIVVLLTIIIIFFLVVLITFSMKINRIATVRNVLNGTLGQSGPSAGFAFPTVADDAVKYKRSVSENCDDDSYLQQDMRWWREVSRSGLCAAVLPERQQ